jgi:HlyD family secretion protein
MNNRAIVAVAGLLVGAAAVFALAFYGKLPGVPSSTSTTLHIADEGSETTTTGAAASSRTSALARVVALARLQPAGGILDLGGLPGDRIEKISVKPGQAVTKGQKLVELESAKLRQLELEAAQSQLDDANKRLLSEQTYGDAVVKQAEAGLDEVKLDDLEVTAQETRIKSLELQAATAERSYQRTSKLSAEITSPQQLDQVKLLRDQAANELAAAQDQVKKLKAGRDLRQRIAGLKQKEALAGKNKITASVPLESLRKAVEAANERLKQSTLTAPSDGVVLEVLGDEGDAVGPTPIIRLGNVAQMVALAEVYETQAGSLRPGQRCELTGDALPRKLSGTVERVGTMVGKNRMLSVDPTHGADAHVVEVRISLDAESSRAAGAYVGLQTTATIDVKQ